MNRYTMLVYLRKEILLNKYYQKILSILILDTRKQEGIFDN